MDEHLVEPAPARPILRFIAQVPFAEDPCRVARGFEDLRKRCGLEREALAFQYGVRNAIAKFMAPGEKRRTRWRARRTDVKIDEAYTLSVEPVDIGSPENGISVTRQITVA